MRVVQKRGRVAGMGGTTASVQRVGAPGKRTLVERVQRRGAGASSVDVHAAAERGIDTPATTLPHADAIQRSFGPDHDVSGITAHVGGDAAAARDDMDASAYAAGDHTVFAEAPSLHTAAHEAAHVVQQAKGVNLEGGVGDAGDAYEAHADAVADRVVAGESAADLLSSGPLAHPPEGGWGGGVQRKILAPHNVQREGKLGGGGGGGGDAAAQPAAAQPDAAGPAAPVADPKAKIARLHLFADIEAADLGIAELQNGSVGHTWIAIEYIDPTTVPDTVHAAHKPLLKTPGKYADPMGFWPDIANGVGYSTNLIKSYVAGWMRHPDRAHEGAEKAMQTWELTQAEVDAVIAYAESKRGAQYSVYFFNCTTFGVQAVAAAGKSAPSASTMGICYPNALYDGIKKRQEKGIGDTMTKDFDGTNEKEVHGVDSRKG
jgi:hypothetical protein